MKRRRLQLRPGQRSTLYALSLLLFASGAAWAWAHQLDESGREVWSGLKPSLLKLHGFAAVGFVLMIGTLLPTHVRRAWHARKNRKNGAFFLTAVGVLTISGYALYYLGDENWRSATRWLHLYLGLVSPLLLWLHVRAGRKAVSPDSRLAKHIVEGSDGGC